MCGGFYLCGFETFKSCSFIDYFSHNSIFVGKIKKKLRLFARLIEIKRLNLRETGFEHAFGALVSKWPYFVDSLM